MKTAEILDILNQSQKQHKTTDMLSTYVILRKFITNNDKGVIEWIGDPQKDTSEIEYHLYCKVLEWAKTEEHETFHTVGELIDYLETLGRDRFLMFDSDGNTDSVTSDNICIWNPADIDSPVAIFID